MNKPLYISFSAMFAIMTVEAVVAYKTEDYLWLATFCLLAIVSAVTALIVKERDLK